MKALIYRYRPTRTADSAGGFTESYGDAIKMYASFIIYKESITLEGLHYSEDIDIEDIIKVENAYYRVIDTTKTPSSVCKIVYLQSIEKPINLD